MQIPFPFGAAEDIAWLRGRLRSRFGPAPPPLRRPPLGQLVRSLISGRTRDEVSAAAHRRLAAAFPDPARLAAAPVAEIEAALAGVTFPEVKARQLRAALRLVAESRPDFDLAFLAGLGVAPALDWLERLPGVGRKVSAATLNFSTLRMPALVVDTHLLRVLRRFGFVGIRADSRGAYDRMMGIVPDWTAAELAELHILMKRLGQSTCHADRPACPTCPLRPRCRSGTRLRGAPGGRPAEVASAARAERPRPA